MKKLGRGIQVSYQSHKEMIHPLERIVAELTERGVEYVGKKLTTGMVVNALIRELLDRPDPQEGAIIALRHLERWALGGMAEPSVPGGIESPGVDVRLGTPGIPPQLHDDPDRQHDRPKKGRRKKSGA